ncbi:hypothetical protein CDUR_00100 [Corynebacterium durum]|nr:hypothetical protein CDUR_00100 [Corynebacterium durum]
MSDSNMINLLEDKHPVRVYKFVQHLDGTDWTLDALEKGFSHRTIKGWAWILQDQDVGTDHVHVLLWTHKEISPEILASWFALPGPRSRTCWPARSRWRPRRISAASSASSWADPRCSTIRRTPWSLATTCTAVAPEAVLT